MREGGDQPREFVKVESAVNIVPTSASHAPSPTLPAFRSVVNVTKINSRFEFGDGSYSARCVNRLNCTTHSCREPCVVQVSLPTPRAICNQLALFFSRVDANPAPSRSRRF